MSLLNWGAGLSAMGQSVANTAGAASLAEQKSDLENQTAQLVNTMAIARDQSNQEANRQSQAQQQTFTAGENEKNRQATVDAETRREAFEQPSKDALNSYYKAMGNAATANAGNSPVSVRPGDSLVDPDTGKVIYTAPVSSGSSTPITLDSTNNNLSAQTGLSAAAISLMTGQSKGMRLGQAQTKALQDEITQWGIKNGVNTSTMLPQVEGAFKVITQNITRNNQAKILENEISGSVSNASDLANKVDLGKLNMANVAAVWAGKQVNDPDAIQTADQLNRLREELASYNAVAGGHMMENGTPAPSPNDYHAAEATITNGINSGGLKALADSVAMSAAKNRVVLQGAVDDANSDYYKLFGAEYHRQTPQPVVPKTPPAQPSFGAPNPTPALPGTGPNINDLLNKYGKPQ